MSIDLVIYLQAIFVLVLVSMNISVLFKMFKLMDNYVKILNNYWELVNHVQKHLVDLGLPPYTPEIDNEGRHSAPRPVPDENRQRVVPFPTTNRDNNENSDNDTDQ